MNNIRIGARLGAAFAFILLFLVIVAFTGFTRILSLGDMADTLAGSRYQKASAATNLRYYSTALRRLVRNVVLAYATDLKAIFKKDYDKVHDKIIATVDQVDVLLKAPKSRELIALIRNTGS